MATPGELLEQERKYRQQAQKEGLYGLGAASAGIAGSIAAYGFADTDGLQGVVQDRLDALDRIGAKDFDPGLRRAYLYGGPYALTTTFAGERLNQIVPPGTSSFEPPDLSMAGQIPEVLKQAESGDTKRQVTVSPSAQPRRLSYEGLTDSDLAPGQGQKGYIWANPSEPQYGYAYGNLRRGAVNSSNPAINLLAVDMPEGRRSPFKTTGEIVGDPSFESNRVWGQRDYGRASGDVMFPKESIRARAEVTAADLYAKLKQNDWLPDGFEQRNLSGPEFKAADTLKELTETFAEKVGKPPVEALAELASPVPALGTSQRNAGSLPIYQQYAVDQASPAALRRGGIGTVFNQDWNPAEGVTLSTAVPGQPGRFADQFQVNPQLVKPIRSPAGNFLRRQSGLGSGLAFSVASPDVVEAIEQGRPAEAAARAGTSALAGTAGEALVKRGMAELSRRGVATPLQAATRIAPPAVAVQLATMSPSSQRQTARQRAEDFKRNPMALGGAGPSADPQLLRAERARRRGGRWRVGPFVLPELGISESGGLFFR